MTISSATEGSTIKYTTDGSDPSSNGTDYSSTIDVADTTTIRAISVKSGMNNSAIAETTIYIRRIIVAGNKYNTDEDWAIKCFDSVGNEDSSWSKEIINIGSDEIKSVVIDSQNNVYVVGYKNYIGGTIATVVIKKYSSDGTEITTGWNKTISTTGGNIDNDNPKAALGPEDKLYLAGYNDHDSTPGDNCWLTGYNSDGTELADNPQRFSGNMVRDIAVDRVNNYIYVVGWGNAGDAKLWAYTHDGSNYSVHFAEKTYNHASPYDGADANKVAVDSNQNVYVGGSYQDASDNNLWFLKKYNSSGTEQTTGWDKEFGPIYDESFETLGIDKNNNVYIEPVDATTTCFLERYNSSGTALADFIMGIDYFFGEMCFDANNNLYGAGYGITWSAGFGSSITDIGWGLGKLDSSGNIVWQKKIFEAPAADE